MFSKIPPDLLADFGKVSGERRHFKAGTSMTVGRETTLSFLNDDGVMMKYLGIDFDNHQNKTDGGSRNTSKNMYWTNDKAQR